MSQLARMLANTADVITSKVPGVRVSVNVKADVGNKVEFFIVRAVLENPGLSCPDEIVLHYSGDLSLGGVAMQASDFLTDVVDAQVYPHEDTLSDE